MERNATGQSETSGDVDRASPPFLLLVADDLIMPSRVREGCRPLGYALRVAPTEAAALAFLAAPNPPLAVLVNLTARRYDPDAVIRAVKSDARFAAIPLLAFAGHVEKAKHEKARTAGADMVAANSSVSLHLPALLARLLTGQGDAPSLDEGERRGEHE